MPDKTPVLLTVYLETATNRWFVAGIDLQGDMTPLLVSEPGNLDPYRGVEFDEQVSFLRHRLSGVLQRGCDRLWGRGLKPCQIVFVLDGPFRDAAPQLAQRLGEHMAEWMTKPPVVFLTVPSGQPQATTPPHTLAGELTPSHLAPWQQGWPQLWQAAQQLTPWELIPTTQRSAAHSS